jgi:hypothetical protein
MASNSTKSELETFAKQLADRLKPLHLGRIGNLGKVEKEEENGGWSAGFGSLNESSVRLYTYLGPWTGKKRNEFYIGWHAQSKSEVLKLKPIAKTHYGLEPSYNCDNTESANGLWRLTRFDERLYQRPFFELYEWEDADPEYYFGMYFRRNWSREAILNRCVDFVHFFFEAVDEERKRNADEIEKRMPRSIKVRRGAKAFRDKLLGAYGFRCAISDSKVRQALEAAHIIPHTGRSSDTYGNGILIRADIHILFDLHLLSINPRTRKVMVDRSLEGTEYEAYRGIVISTENPSFKPAKSSLQHHLTRAETAARRRGTRLI